jgi:hypothetical protein
MSEQTNAVTDAVVLLVKKNADLVEALELIVTICTESAGDCRKRMGTRVGNTLVTALAALKLAKESA